MDTQHISHEEFMRRMANGPQEDTFQASDMVESPPHYNKSDIECIDAIKAALGDNFIHYLTGTSLKYLWRYRLKGKPQEDLRKCRWYIDRAIEEAGDNP